MATNSANDIDVLEERLRQRVQQKQYPLETKPLHVKPQGSIPNTPLSSATIAFILGMIFGGGLYVTAKDIISWPISIPYQFGVYIASWAFFHWAEFAVTAGWNLEKCTIDSYLLENGSMYHIAHATAILEYAVTSYFIPHIKTYPYLSEIGLAVLLSGQILRSCAMIHASTNFSHAVAFYKVDGHRLVTDGVYSWFRHPSYTGFFYWALGTQMLLQNPISFILFWVVMWKFFSSRIRAEEKALIKFFGNDYIAYRSRVGTKIPFIP